MKELSLLTSGTLAPNNFAPIVVPNLYRGVWSASQTGNLITVSSPRMGFTAGISPTGLMTVSAIDAGTLIENGQNIYGVGVPSWCRVTGVINAPTGGVGIYTVPWFRNTYTIDSVNTATKTITVKETMVSGTTIGWTISRGNVNYTVDTVDTVAKTITLIQSLVGTDALGWTVFQQEISIPADTVFTCGHQHNMGDQTDPYAGISNYGVKVYLSFPRNPYLTTGFYENIIVTSTTSFTCLAENTRTTPVIIPVLTTWGVSVVLHPYRIKIPKNTVTVNSSIRFESLIKFGTHSVGTGENYGVSLGSTNIQGVQGGTFYNHNNIAGSAGGNSYHHYSLIKLLGDGNYLCNHYGAHGSFGTASMHNNSPVDFILNDGFDLIPSASMNNENPDRSIVPKEWCINTYQLWTNISVDYVR